ncbi:MAG: hypothetical protein O3A00_18680 [Planctomycetota bacterium]|nr:hypothetical protein [Planctomycetota bacterium]
MRRLPREADGAVLADRRLLADAELPALDARRKALRRRDPQARFAGDRGFGESATQSFVSELGSGEVPTEWFAIRLGSGLVPTGGLVMAGGSGRANGRVGGLESS